MTTTRNEVMTLLEGVFDAFEESGVRWALLRGRSELHTGRDTDLLVAAEHQGVAQEIVYQLGGAPYPQRRYPWHHMYVLDTPGSGPNLKLDIVNELVFNREARITSDLARGCLERRVRDEALYELSPTDTFWTILLHCVLDKGYVKPDRGDELLARVDRLDRPSPGEEFFAGLCPADWSPDRAIDCVVRRDWAPLGRLGSEILSQHAVESGPRRKVRRIDKVRRRGTDLASGSAYRKAWRAAGLGSLPQVVDLVEEAEVDATVTELRRRPGRTDVTVEVDADQLSRLLLLMPRAYREQDESWRRVHRTGVETGRLVPGSGSGEQVASDALLLPGHHHCRLSLPPAEHGTR